MTGTVQTGGRSPWRMLLIILTVVSALLLVTLVARYFYLRHQIANVAFAGASEQALAAARQVDQSFANTMDLTAEVAADLSSGVLAFEDIEARLTELLRGDPLLDGITVAFDRGAYSTEYDLFIVYVWRDESGAFQTQIGESRYDYTVPPSDDPDAAQTAWFYNPMHEGAQWTEPFLAAGAGRVLIEYGVPFSSPGADSGPTGIVATDYSLEGMRALVAELELGQGGFGAVYSDSGTFLSHPIPERIVAGNIFSDPTLQEANFQEAARAALEGESVSVQRDDNDQRVWNFFAPINATSWALVVQLSDAEFLLGAGVLLGSAVSIALASGAFLFFLTALLLHFDEATRDRLWLASITFSIIGVAVILAIIILERSTPVALGEGVLMTSQAGIKRYEDTLRREYERRGLRSPISVPTGVLLQSARFAEANVVAVNGYVWQLVPKVEGQVIQPGISLPQLIDEPMAFEEVYREERENETLIIWTLTAALRQSFDPVQYPLDRYDINVRMAPLEFANNLVLYPDLQSYNANSPSQLPGVDDTVQINNWQLRASAFSMAARQYGTDFGIDQRPTVDVPELAYNMRVERRFLGPFVAFFLPALVATIMIFGYLINDNKPDEAEEIVTALSYTAALFFVIAVLHNTLRDNAAAIGLTYLEYFYLLLYVLTLFVAANTFLVVRYPYLPIVSIGNNLIAKLLFWPVVVGFMLVVTLMVFVFSG